jgi:hypothetical protein
MLRDLFIGIDKLERLKLLPGVPGSEPNFVFPPTQPEYFSNFKRRDLVKYSMFLLISLVVLTSMILANKEQNYDTGF